MTTMSTDIDMLRILAMKPDRSQKGNVLVEFALILPAFLALLFGMITFSVAMYNKTVLTMATREGARAGAKYAANQTDASRMSSARTVALQACQDHMISFGGGATPDVPITTIQNKILTVSATCNYTGLYIFSASLPRISAQSSMRIE